MAASAIIKPAGGLLGGVAGRNAAFEDLSNVEFETSEDVDVIDQFKEMHLKEELIRGIFAYGKLFSYININIVKPTAY